MSTKKRPRRLTPKEWNAIYDALSFLEETPINGGPLEGPTDAETEDNVATLKSAMSKVIERVRAK